MEPSLSPEEFEKRVKFYFRDCEESRKVFPDEAGMINYIFQGTDCEDEDAEFEELKTTEGYDKILRWAKRRRTSWLERKMVSDPKLATGCKNALQQEKNGGYSDKPMEKKDRQLIVKLDMTGEMK